MVGIDRRELETLIGHEVHAPNAPTLHASSNQVTIEAGSGSAAQVLLVRYDPNIVQIPIRRGENGGKTLPHKNVVKELVVLGAWSGKSQSYTLPPARVAGLKAAVLVQDRTSRLTKLLVYDRQVATRVSAWQGAKEGVGTLEIDVTPRPGVTLATVEQLVDSALAALRTTAPITAAEVERYRRYTQVMTVLSLDGSMMHAEMLLYGETFTGDPAYYRTSTAALLAVTPADLARVAATYLTPGRVVLSMVPAGKLALIAAPDSSYTNVTPSPNAPSNAP